MPSAGAPAPPLVAGFLCRGTAYALWLLDIATTPSHRAAQAAHGNDGLYEEVGTNGTFDRSGPADDGFTAARDSCYLAGVSEAGRRYVQHCCGRLGFTDFRGDRQNISLGNPAVNHQPNETADRRFLRIGPAPRPPGRPGLAAQG